jgi:hypothetical protein
MTALQEVPASRKCVHFFPLQPSPFDPQLLLPFHYQKCKYTSEITICGPGRVLQIPLLAALISVLNVMKWWLQFLAVLCSFLLLEFQAFAYNMRITEPTLFCMYVRTRQPVS